MNYQPYVIAAYAVFVAAMLWDWVAPRLQARKWLRAAALQARRGAGRRASPVAAADARHDADAAPPH